MSDTTESLRAVPKDLSEIAKAITLGEVAPEDAKTIRDCASAWRTALTRLEAAERAWRADVAYHAMLRRQADRDVEPMPLEQQRVIEQEQIAASKAWAALALKETPHDAE